MEDRDIIKALEHYRGFRLAPYFNHKEGDECIIVDDALDLINRQKANYEALKAQEEKSHQYCKNVCEPKYKAEIKVKNKLLDIAEEKFETIKADTIQEFIKRFEKKIKDVEFTIGQAWEIKSAIKEVVKEMVGESK